MTQKYWLGPVFSCHALAMPFLKGLDTCVGTLIRNYVLNEES